MAGKDWAPRLDALQDRKASAREGDRDRHARRREAGLYSAREWIDHLLDHDTFSELGLLVGDLPADGFITGFGLVDGRPVLVGAEDFTVKGGSLGVGSSTKRHRLVELARQELVPLVMFLDGAGARVEARDAPPPRIPYDLQELVRLSGQVPMVAAVMGVSAGHGALAAPLSDVVIMCEQSALFTAGPPVVKAALGEEVDRQELGGPGIHTVVSGVAHVTEPDHLSAVDAVRRYLRYFPTNAWATSPRRISDDTGPRRLDEILDIIPAARRTPYDVRDVIEILVDDADYFELSPRYGPSLVTALTHIGGEVVAILANQPSQHGGAITAAAAEKGAHLIEVCDAFHLPLLFLTDTPGVLPGRESEAQGILRSGARMLAAQVRATSPKIQVTLGKAFGFGAAIMSKVSFDAQTLNLALPGGSAGALPAGTGGSLAKLTSADTDALIRMEDDATLQAAKRFAIDDAIDPRDLRNAVLAGLRLSAARRNRLMKPVERGGIRP